MSISASLERRYGDGESRFRRGAIIHRLRQRPIFVKNALIEGNFSR